MPASPSSPGTSADSPLVGIIMGSRSDWPTMQAAAERLAAFAIPHECRVVSAHRTPAFLAEYASTAANRGIRVIIAGAGGAAHLPGMAAAYTHLPVIGVPIETRALKGMDSLLSIVQMPRGTPVATMAIGEAGAVNAAFMAARILGVSDARVARALQAYAGEQRELVLAETLQ